MNDSGKGLYTTGICNEAFAEEGESAKDEVCFNSKVCSFQGAEPHVTETESKYRNGEGDPRSSDISGVAAEVEVEVSKPSESLPKTQKVETSLKKWFTGTNFLVYISHFLSAWGDRMWSFGVGLFLVNIASQNLQLTAMYGLASGLTIFFLGAIVGDWVDSTPRLKAAKLSLILQNGFVVVCAVGVYVYLWFEHDITKREEREWLVPLCHTGIILFAILANLASLARTIAVERDWIVEICGKDKDMLATMTASLRRIDQGTVILAPIATGQIMTYAGPENGAVFIAVWNIVSVFIEYYLMWKVYNTVPQLRARKDFCRAEKTPGVEVEENMDVDKAAEKPVDDLTPNAEDVRLEVISGDVTKPDLVEAEEAMKQARPEQEDEVNQPPSEACQTLVVKARDVPRGACCSNARICSQLLVLQRGWRTYMGYSVALAGLALACLYMTVLGFDNITVAYAVTQGVSESVVGILMGASAVFGILGTFAYPIFRRRLGLVRTGIFALSMQVSCLSLCVVAIWMPGSPFDPLYYIRPQQVFVCGNTTVTQASVLRPVNESAATYNVSTVSADVHSPDIGRSGNLTDCYFSRGPESYLSVGLLMGGMVLARFGLWIADLTITQLFLEVVVEKERGVVSGVQSSLNMLMDVLKFALVVAIPDTQTFGYLTILSFAFICLGWLFYAIFLRRNRGHFFHFEKCAKCVNSHAIAQPT